MAKMNALTAMTLLQFLLHCEAENEQCECGQVFLQSLHHSVSKMAPFLGTYSIDLSQAFQDGRPVYSKVLPTLPAAIHQIGQPEKALEKDEDDDRVSLVGGKVFLKYGKWTEHMIQKDPRTHLFKPIKSRRKKVWSVYYETSTVNEKSLLAIDHHQVLSESLGDPGIDGYCPANEDSHIRLYLAPFTADSTKIDMRRNENVTIIPGETVFVRCGHDVFASCCTNMVLRVDEELYKNVPFNYRMLLGAYDLRKDNYEYFYKHSDATVPMLIGHRVIHAYLFIYQYHDDRGSYWIIGENVGQPPNATNSTVLAYQFTSDPCPQEGRSTWEVRHEQNPREISCTNDTNTEACKGHNNETITYIPEPMFETAVAIKTRCVVEDYINTCQFCPRNSECKYHHHATEDVKAGYACDCKEGFSKTDHGYCVPNLGTQLCYECFGPDCKSPDNEALERMKLHCPVGVFSCRVFVEAPDQASLDPTASIRRMCGTGNLTRVECIGLKNESNYVEKMSRYTDTFTGHRIYYDQPFICGPNMDCWGDYRLPEAEWHIFCRRWTIGIKCKDEDTSYENGTVITGLTTVRCLGRASIRVPYYKSYDPSIFDLSQSARLPETKDAKARPQEIDDITKWKLIPAFSRYFRRDIVSKEFFSECHVSTFAPSPLEEPVEGIMCYCNAPMCNGASDWELLNMISKANEWRGASPMLLLAIFGGMRNV